MTIAPVGSAALLVLRQAASSSTRPPAEVSPADRLTAAAGNAAIGRPAAPLAEARGKVAEALFDRSVPDVNAMKVHLYEALGEEFGISISDFETPRDFGAAIAEKIGQMRREPNGSLMLSEIEKRLGLDKLGISLDTLVDAVINAGGESDAKLTRALEAKLGEEAGGGKSASPSIARLGSDEIGLYRI